MRSIKWVTSLAVAVGCFFAVTGTVHAQQYGWVEGTQYSHTPGYPGVSYATPYYRNWVYNLNGSVPASYAGWAQNTLPTYMTSINYPTIYGQWGYLYAPGRFTYGAGLSSFTTSPTIYGVVAAPGNSMTAVRYLPDTAQTPLATTATVTVIVPTSAELRMQGIRMNEGGQRRTFVTPDLVPGELYTYDLTATWPDNGKVVTQARHINLRAGDRSLVDFTTAPTPETTTTLRAAPLP
jgi:uncharacterized protein (TIGR03000 family)